MKTFTATTLFAGLAAAHPHLAPRAEQTPPGTVLSQQGGSAAGLTQISLQGSIQQCVAQAQQQQILIQGIEAQALQSALPFLAGVQGFSNVNLLGSGIANSAILDLTNLAAIAGAVFDQVMGLQVVEVIQQNLGTIGVAPLIQGLAVESGFPIIQNGQIIQIVDINSAIASGLNVNSLVTPILVNGALQQIFPIDASVLLASQALGIAGLPIISGVSMAGIPLSIASNSLWNLNVQNAQLGLLNSGVSNILSLSLGTPFFIQSSSFFGQSNVFDPSISALAAGAAFLPPTNVAAIEPVFLVADSSAVVDFSQLAQLQIVNQLQFAIPTSISSVSNIAAAGLPIPPVAKY